ncbi:uncharacterized protein LOC110187988 [Drosophila serrata]|uniref:uncharacterized protein LOC110187988 n=1 Tax=Drosophila serrata TaxID=7274 RepID=UPI000A1D15EE|nr:uncharacterized protein LOC110187988 [Drosophila serrata]KAH8374591.1 hypothetical protein KR200_001816 [Drosophila serrata]
MAFRYIFVISAFIVLAQGSNISPVEQETEVGVHSSGGVSSGAAVSGISRGHAAGPQSQRPASGYGSTGGPQSPRPQGGAARRSSGGAYRPSGGASRPSGGANRPSGGAQAGRQGQANPHQARSQKPY